MMAVQERTQGKASKAVAAPSSDGESATERRCLVAGVLRPRTQMVRFVIGPDQTVVPDISEKLPGHGLWVTADRKSIAEAVKKNLFAKAAKEPAKPALDLADLVTTLLKRRTGELLGMAKGAGIAVLGEKETQAALRGKRIALFLRAPDATQVLDNRNDITEFALLTRDEMGAALGYDQIVYAGLASHGLTDRLKLELSRLRTMTDPTDTLLHDSPPMTGEG
jgi:predicted RNA-binding protein YlxR (DUF448 family)